MRSFFVILFWVSCLSLVKGNSARQCATDYYEIYGSKDTDFPLPEKCDLSKSVIVLSFGHSGSGYIVEMLSKVYMNHSRRGDFGELFGATTTSMSKISNPLKIVKNHLCPSNSSGDLYRGFKWKPYWWNEGYMAAMQWVAHHQIPVVYSTRNPIDRHLSNKRHRESALSPHCRFGDSVCVQKHLDEQLTTVNTTDLINELTGVRCEISNIKFLLNRLQVKYIEVPFEELSSEYCSNETMVRRWREVLEFIEPATQWGDKLSPEVLTPVLEITSSIHHRDKIRNYDEAKAALRGTAFAELLN